MPSFSMNLCKRKHPFQPSGLGQPERHVFWRWTRSEVASCKYFIWSMEFAYGKHLQIESKEMLFWHLNQRLGLLAGHRRISELLNLGDSSWQKKTAPGLLAVLFLLCDCRNLVEWRIRSLKLPGGKHGSFRTHQASWWFSNWLPR